MPLPHFGIPHNFNIEPVNESGEVCFYAKDKYILQKSLFKIESDIIYFNLVFDKKLKKVEIAEVIHRMINNKEEFDLIVYYIDKNNSIMMSYILKSCIFAELINPIDVSYDGDNMKCYKVRMKYKKYKYFENEKKFRRYTKVMNILSE